MFIVRIYDVPATMLRVKSDIGGQELHRASAPLVSTCGDEKWARATRADR